MFYTIALMLIFAVILLVFDHKSRYTWLFVLMAVGAMIAFFFIILHINIFASYGYYAKYGDFYWLDWRVFQWITGLVSIPIVTNFRMINLGISLYLLAVTIFNYVFSKELTRKKRIEEKGSLHSNLLLLFLVPVVSLILPDPNISTRMYIAYHTSRYPEWNFFLYRVLEVGYKLLVLFLLVRPVVILLRSMMAISLPFLKKRLILFLVGLSLTNGIFYLFFYIGRLGISAQKVIRSGFWIFENIEGMIPPIYLTGSVLIFVVICFCMFMLLSFRMDISATLFLERKIRKNVAIMNEVLGETLHSQKNLFFSMQILVRKIKKQLPEESRIPELERLNVLVDNSLVRVTEMLDELRVINYHYLHNNILDIIDGAVKEVYLPEHVALEWNREEYEGESTFGMYDKYHLEKAMVNVINNAVEAIELSGRLEGKISIQLDFLLSWMVVSIWDNGIGIHRKDRNRIFTPHYSGKQGKLNWGLGLPYVYKVVKAHLGQIRIDSKYGEYTSVLLMLPGGKR